jgi:hypothetical protein
MIRLGGELVRPVEEQQFHAGRGAGEQAEVCAGSRNCGTQRMLMPVVKSLARSVSVAGFPAEAMKTFPFMAGASKDSDQGWC